MNSEELEIRAYQNSDEGGVIRLWTDCKLVVPQNDPQKDIRTKLDFQPDLLLVGIMNDEIVATAMVGYEGHRGWVNYLAVSPSRQRLGLGRKIMEAAEQKLKALGCPKLNIQVRTTNTSVIEFYKKIGFLDDNVLGLGKRL